MEINIKQINMTADGKNEMNFMMYEITEGRTEADSVDKVVSKLPSVSEILFVMALNSGEELAMPLKMPVILSVMLSAKSLIVVSEMFIASVFSSRRSPKVIAYRAKERISADSTVKTKDENLFE